MEERIQVYEMGCYGRVMVKARDNDLGMDLKKRVEVFASGEETRVMEIITASGGG